MLRSTTVEIILYYLTNHPIKKPADIYNSRNYSILLNIERHETDKTIYNSRNYSILLNCFTGIDGIGIYNSRNYSILLNYNQTESELNHLQQ